MGPGPEGPGEVREPASTARQPPRLVPGVAEPGDGIDQSVEVPGHRNQSPPSGRVAVGSPPDHAAVPEEAAAIAS
jgi:hypothetical protein